MTRRFIAIAIAGTLIFLAGLWFGRARLAAEFAQSYFRHHGVTASMEVGTLGLSGASGRFALGPADAPELSADSVEFFFDPLRWKPYLVEVRLKNPVVRAHLDARGRLTLPSLQSWLDSLSQSKEKSPYVSGDLAVSFTGLRALLATPGGAVEIDGDAKLVKMQPVSAALTLKPGALRYQDIAVRVDQAALVLAANGNGYRLSMHFAGDVARGDLAATKLEMTAQTPRLRLNDGVTTDTLQLKASAQQLRGAGVTANAAALTLDAKGVRFQNGALTLAGGTAKAQLASLEGPARATAAKAILDLRDVTLSPGGMDGDGALALDAALALPGPLRRMVRDLPLLALDAPLKAAVADNLGPILVSVKAKMARHDGRITVTAPLALRSAKGASLRVPALAVTWKDGIATGSLQATLAGGGLPSFSLAASSFTLDGIGLRANIGVKSRLDFATFKGIDATLDGALTAGRGRFSFILGRCEAFTLAALGPLAAKISGQVCPGGAPLFALDGTGWRAAAEAKDIAAFLPLANARLSESAARLAFDGRTGPRGSIAVTAATIIDAATPRRFQPVSGNGEVDLAEMTWHGRFAVSDGKNRSLGTIALAHAMVSGDGGAHIEAPLLFAQDGLQPEDISPLLAPLKKADGRAGFKGDIAWTSGGLGANTGTLTTRDFNFLTPMGRAHSLDTSLALTSLLPPATADGQDMTIARVDWTLPFTDLGLRFGFNTQAVTIERAETNIAEGHVALSPFTVKLDAPGAAGSAAITGLSLAPLIAASNLSGKATLQGKVSGVIPFTASAEGFRIQDGHLKADGPGRLELNRSLWGDNAVAANAVQDFAYQALESLAFDTLTADIDSVDKGRLQIVFHIKGKSDPPRPQRADVAVADILNGTALYKPIPLPSGTPIELTLDTSLNFDELLKSYAEAWSNALNGGTVK